MRVEAESGTEPSRRGGHPDAPVPVQDLPQPLVDFLQIISIPGNGEVADLSRKNAFHGGYLFSPDETTFYDTYFPDGGGSPGTLETIDLATGKVIASRGGLPSGTRPIGFSRGCPVLLDPGRGAYRSCETCDELPVPANETALVSPDGTALLTMDAYPALTSTLWSLPGDQPLHVFARPPADEVGGGSIWATPIASATAGVEVLIGGGDDVACYAGPGFQTLLEDASGNILDQLPPGGSPASEDLARVLYGTELWCRR